MSKSFSVLEYLYIDNEQYKYDPDTQENSSEQIPTGWQVLPNQLWMHYMTPTQMWSMMNECEAVRMASCSITVCNMIPITESVAIQGNTTFSAFNNTIYAIGYSDSIYETHWHTWDDTIRNFNIAYKEGCINQGGTWARTTLPHYEWHNYVPGWSAANQSGVFWDPLCRPQEIMELRPGKNAIRYSWNRHPADDDKWYNTDAIINYNNFATNYALGQDNPQSAMPAYQKLSVGDNLGAGFDVGCVSRPPDVYTLHCTPTFENDVQINLWRQCIFSEEVENSQTIRRFGRALGWFNNLADPRYSWRYPITQWFIKMIPLFKEDHSLIDTIAQVCLQKTITFDVKERKTALFTTCTPQDRNNYLFRIGTSQSKVTAPVIRGRSGGIPMPYAAIAGNYPWSEYRPPLTQLPPAHRGQQSEPEPSRPGLSELGLTEASV